MLDILRSSPIESGGLKICFDREPDIFTMARLKYDPAKYIGIFIDEHLLGFGLIGYHTGLVSGEPQKVFHLSNVFMRREFRNKGLFLRAHEEFFREVSNNSFLGYAIIMKGNKNAERYVGWMSEKYSYIPYSERVAAFEARNVFITFKKRESRVTVRKAGIDDISAIVSLLADEFSGRLFAPDINIEAFNKNLCIRPDFSIDNYYVAEKEGQIVGTCAAWDCSSFKQIRILSYSRNLLIIRKILTVVSALFRIPDLPDTGQALKAVYITDCAVQKRDPKLLNALLRKVYNEYRRKMFNLLIYGSYKDDKLLKATKGFFYQPVESNIILIHNDKSEVEKLIREKQYPHIEVAFL